MSYIKNLLSIFKWGKKDKDEENPENIKIQPLVSELKNWVIQELPPLSWERIVLRSCKYMLQRYKKR